MYGWEFNKIYYECGTRWKPIGWNIFTPTGILTYNLDGDCIRDRLMYR